MGNAQFHLETFRARALMNAQLRADLSRSTLPTRHTAAPFFADHSEFLRKGERFAATTVVDAYDVEQQLVVYLDWWHVQGEDGVAVAAED